MANLFLYQRKQKKRNKNVGARSRFFNFQPREITYHRGVSCGEGLLTNIILPSNLSTFLPVLPVQKRGDVFSFEEQ